MKLSGWRWRGRQVLRLHPRVEQDTVVDTVLALLEKLEEEESVLVEAMCPCAQLPFPGESHLCQPGLGAWWLCAGLRPLHLPPGGPSPSPELTVRICTVVCRTQGDRPLLSKVRTTQVQDATLPTTLQPSPTDLIRAPEQSSGQRGQNLRESWLPLGKLLGLTLLPSPSNPPEPLLHREPLPQCSAPADY